MTANHDQTPHGPWHPAPASVPQSNDGHQTAPRRCLWRVGACLTWLCLALTLPAQETAVLLLSGTGPHDAVPWEFRIDSGRRAGQWSTIPVPSNWETEGYGSYVYGKKYSINHRTGKAKEAPSPELRQEVGHYRHRFQVPVEWRDRRVRLVVGAAQQQATVRIDGVQAGPVHYGGFYEFRHDISHLVQAGQEHLLEIDVAKVSDNESVWYAEAGDFWLFGGIMRPVWLEAVPMRHIDWWAIDAQADGGLRARIHGVDTTGLRLRIQVRDGDQLLAEQSALAQQDETLIDMSVPGVEPWSAERPRLYTAACQLLDDTGTIVHSVEERIGFRSIAFTDQGGLLINGAPVILRGVNRHCFRPESARCLSPAMSREDLEAMRDMNMNAVRCAHYPPDRHFLQLCDEMGFYVIDELLGWQNPVDTTVGRQQVYEMIRRDVNHPSIILWANGNEDGWNTEIEPDYHRWDLQQRPVIHPRGETAAMVCPHYQTPKQFEDIVRRGRTTLTTEFVHSLYEGGGGAGLAAFDAIFRKYDNAIGGFIWAFHDEAVRRDDQNGRLDEHYNYAPDGLLGPHLTWEDSAHTVRELWSPVQVVNSTLTAASEGTLTLENRYARTDLDTCQLHWHWQSLDPDGGSTTLAHTSTPAPACAPGARVTTSVPSMPAAADADLLALDIQNAAGRVLWTWTWSLREHQELRERFWGTAQAGKVDSAVQEDVLVLRAANQSWRFDLEYGQLLEWRAGDTVLPFGRGPVRLHRPTTTSRVSHGPDDAGYRITAEQQAGSDGFQWTVYGDGSLRLDWQAPASSEKLPAAGISFQFPDDQLASLRFCGEGPTRSWRNRRHGTRFGIWDLPVGPASGGRHWLKPLHHGCFADMRWARLGLHAGGSLELAVEQAGLALGIDEPPQVSAYRHNNTSGIPADSLSLIDLLPMQGSKFKDPDQLGDKSLAQRADQVTGTLWIRWNDRDDTP